jgi:hypothetical protein
VLVSTSTPTRTAPVIRGKWILEQILGTPPPPPPPDVPPLSEQKAVSQTASLRQRLEQHRSQAECAGCHAKMDPLGFALENFDATGAWRDSTGNSRSTPPASSPTARLQSARASSSKCSRATRTSSAASARKMMTYALGRGLEFYDKCACDCRPGEAANRGTSFPRSSPRS